MFSVTDKKIDTVDLKAALANNSCGACVTFEGWVRNHSHGKSVKRLEYEVYAELAIREGERILKNAQEKFPLELARCVHREGPLNVGDCSVWVGVSAKHRDEAFKACRYIIDEIKQRLPIWKKEYYGDGDSGWVNCERCETPRQKPAAAS